MLSLALFDVVSDAMLQSVLSRIELWVLCLLSRLVLLKQLPLLLRCQCFTVDSLVLLLQLGK